MNVFINKISIVGNRIIISEQEKQSIKKLYGVIGEQDYSAGYISGGRSYKSDPSSTNINPNNITFDNIVDIVSAVLDGIPGIGNLASFGIDVIHAISYLIRMGLSNDEDYKIENGCYAILTLATAFFPLGGNVVNIASRAGIRKILQTTPDVIKSWAKKHGIINVVFLLQKTKFQYSIALLLARLLKEKAQDVIVDVIDKIKDLKVKVGDVKFNGINLTNWINFLITNLEEILEVIDIANDIVNRNNDFNFQ